MNSIEETFSGFISTRNLNDRKNNKPYREKSKSKEKKRDWSKERERKRNYE